MCGKGNTPRYDDVLAMGGHVCKRVYKTPVADRFPPQACDLQWGYKANRLTDRTAKGKDRATFGLI